MTAIKCIGIKKFYGKGENKTAALRGIDLEIAERKNLVPLAAEELGDHLHHRDFVVD